MVLGAVRLSLLFVIGDNWRVMMLTVLLALRAWAPGRGCWFLAASSGHTGARRRRVVGYAVTTMGWRGHWLIGCEGIKPREPFPRAEPALAESKGVGSVSLLPRP